MASKLKVDEVSNVAGAGYVVTSAGVSLDMSNAGSALGIPRGTTAQRPAHSDGFLRFNTDLTWSSTLFTSSREESKL